MTNKKRQSKGLTAKAASKSKSEKAGKGKDNDIQKNINIPVIGIGASAGGLEAIEAFFSNLPAQCGMAFVVIQHFAPGHKSMMDVILAKYTTLKVVVITEGLHIVADTIYIPPSGHNVELSDDRFHLSERDDVRAEDLPVDHFFRSLAQNCAEKAICIILSGTGADGTQGLKAIKEVGGMTIAQDEKQAKYPGMPRSAIQNGSVDFILPVEKMLEAIDKYIHHPFVSKPKIASSQQLPEAQDALKRVLYLLHMRTGHDFSEYKQTTIRRRIDRRMAVNAIESMYDYVKLLERNPDELELLFGDILIGVTRFFRDPEAYDALARKGISAILSNKYDDSEFRVWVVGCATGEEVYSLAILLTEIIEDSHKRINLQIFASDIDNRSIEYARKGLYPASIAEDVSVQRLERFFAHEDSVYRIKRSIRDCVVFALQDVTKDPPFSRIDLLSCRNVLIYMDRELQNKVLPVFHYSLMENGILFLGTSESVGDLAADFRNIDTRFKIYQKVGTISPATGTHRIHERLAIPQPAPLTAKTDTPVRTLGARVLAEQFSPPAVLVTERMEVRHFYGEVDRYLILASGEASLNVLQIARNGLRPRLAAALTQAIRDNIYISMENVRIRSGEEIVTIDLFVQPLIDPGRVQRFFLVIFRQNESRRKVASRTTKLSVPPAKSVSEIEALSQELKATKEYLQTTIEELQTSNEELRSTNEEFQSTNEELESSREELQSTNEELSTVNSELQEKVDELTQTSNDLNNLLSSTDIATIFLDTDLRIKRFTPTAVKVFRLQEGDIGRPIRDITSELVSINIYKAATEVLNTLVRKDMEVAAEGNRWFIVRILPYRTVDFIIEGVVLTFSEITDLKNALNEYESLESLAAGIVNSIRTPFVVLDTGLKVKVANGPFYELFRVRDVETIDKPIYELGSGQWDIDLLKRALGDIVEKSLPLINFEVEYDFPLIGHRKMILNGSRIEKSKYVYLSIENTAEQNT